MDLRILAKTVKQVRVKGHLVPFRKGRGQRAGATCIFYHCPFHKDNTASLAVYADNAVCYSCKRRWPTARMFLISLAGYSREVALTLLAKERFAWVLSGESKRTNAPPCEVWREKLGRVVREAVDCWQEDCAQPGREELDARLVSEKVRLLYHIGWHPVWDKLEVDGEVVQLAEGIVFPVFYQGLLRSINIRTRSGNPKYLRVCTVPYPVSCVNGLDQMGDASTLIITESDTELALIKTAVLGDAEVMAMRGTSNRLDTWRYVFAAFERRILCLDGDDAGQLAKEKIQEEYPGMFEEASPPHDFGHAVKEDGWSLDDVRRYILDGRRVWL